MVNPERKKNQRHRSIRIVGGGGGDIGAVIAWGGAMAIAGLVAAFAIKTRFGRRKAKQSGKETEKEEPVKKSDNVEEENNGGGRGEEEDQARLNDPNTNLIQTQTKPQIDSVDLVSALLGEKPKDKDDGASHHNHNHHHHLHHQERGPLINYAIPAQAMNPEVQEIIPFTQLKPEFLAGIVEECKSLVDGPVPLKEVQGPVERLILKPIMNQVEAEALLSPITEVEEHDHDYGRGGEEEEHADAHEERGDGGSVSDEIGKNSSAIWPAEMIDELSRELKGMKIELEKPKEKDMLKLSLDNEEIDGIKVMNKALRILKEKEEVVVPVAVKLSRSRTLLRLGVFLLLLLLLLIRFDAMSSVLGET